MGRACADMAVQLVGGPLRFAAKNGHQRPHLLVLVGAGTWRGAYALCAARLLASRACKVHALVVDNAEDGPREVSRRCLFAKCLYYLFLKLEALLFQNMFILFYHILYIEHE